MKMNKIPVKKLNIAKLQIKSNDKLPKANNNYGHEELTDKPFNDNLLSSYREVLEMVDINSERQKLAENLLDDIAER